MATVEETPVESKPEPVAEPEKDATEVSEDSNKTEGQDVKTEDSTLLEMKIIRQVEYYFGNVNLWRDKFLQEKITEDDGWVTIECLTTFNRLQALSTDFEEIVTALQKSKTGLLEIHEDRQKVRRSPKNPLPDRDDPILRKQSRMKTLHVKGFPLSYSLDDIQDFILSQQCQNIFIKMKYNDDKSFKGSIIVELSTLSEAEKFLKDELKIGDTVLKVLRRDAYYDQKNEKRLFNKDSGKRRGDGDRGYGKRPKPEENDGNDKENGKDKEKAEDDKNDNEAPKLGCVIHFKGCGKDTSREDLKQLFGEHEPVEWVDFNMGETQGYVRFVNEGVAQKVLDAVKAAHEDKLVIKEKECEGKVIEGIEEKNYWILANEERKRAAKNRGQSNRGSRHNSRGNSRGRKNFHKKDRNQEWRKRRREWEYPKEEKAEEKGDEKPKNQHTKFDDEGIAEKDNVGETVEKKVKVEEKPAAAEV